MWQRLQRNGSVIYIAGYLASLALTITAYAMVMTSILDVALINDSGSTIAILAALAVAQLIVQMLCFLHFGQEKKPRWNSISTLAMIMVVTFIVGGSIWVMHNLDYNMMQREDVETQIMHDEGIHR